MRPAIHPKVVNTCTLKKNNNKSAMKDLNSQCFFHKVTQSGSQTSCNSSHSTSSLNSTSRFSIKNDYALNEGLQNQWAPSIQFASQILVGQDG
jgi:hypothetical protein